MVYASVREDNLRALASGLLPEHTQNHIITCILHPNTFAFCALRDTWRFTLEYQ